MEGCKCDAKMEHLRELLTSQKEDLDKVESTAQRLEIQVTRLVTQLEGSRKFFYAAIVPGIVSIMAVIASWVAK